MSGADCNNLYAKYRQQFPADLNKTLLTLPNGADLSYADIDQASAQAAHTLSSLGLEKGARVSVQVEKSPAMLSLYLGVLRAGMVFHPLNPAYTAEELDFFFADAQPALVVCDPSRQSEVTALGEKHSVPQVLTLGADGKGSWAEHCAIAAQDFETVPCEASELAALIYSSGTTGRPKGIMLSHRNLAVNTATLVECWGFGAEDCLLHALPVFHVHGLFVAIGCVLMSGASMRWLPKFDIQLVLQELANSTVMMGVPTYYTRLLAQQAFNAEQCRSIRVFISGSAPLLKETFDEFEARTGHLILERYGMSETGMNTSNPLHGPRRAGTVGLPLPGVSVRVVGDGGQPVPAGDIGNLQVKGDNVFQGYWNLPDKTREDFTEDGYFMTGDQANIDEQGYVSIVGRAKDMIISGGLNVYPKEIETIIDELPGVSESAVIGLPHTDFGEAVAAVIVAQENVKLDHDDIVQALKYRLANFKVPKHLYVVDELPRNAMGKVQKNVLRERYS